MLKRLLLRVGKRNASQVRKVNIKQTVFAVQHSLDDVFALPASWSHMRQVLGRMWFAVVLVFAGVRIGILFLIKIAECVVYFSVLALIGADY